MGLRRISCSKTIISCSTNINHRSEFFLNTNRTNNTNVDECVCMAIPIHSRDSWYSCSIKLCVWCGGFRVWFLNTDYTNGTNVDAWGFRYIRVIRDIRVPLNCTYGVLGGAYGFWTRIARIARMWMNNVAKYSWNSWNLCSIQCFRVINIEHEWHG